MKDASYKNCRRKTFLLEISKETVSFMVMVETNFFKILLEFQICRINFSTIFHAETKEHERECI